MAVENAMVLVTRDDLALVRSVVHALEGGLESADGIPRWIDGAPVFRPTEAVEVAREQTDDTPFLLGGLVRGLPAAMPAAAFRST